MTYSLPQAIGQKLMLTFMGTEPSPEILATIARQHVGGITLFRTLGNTEHPTQILALTQALQSAAAAAGQPPLLIATDQEGGQLMPIDRDVTLLPGNLALGATGSPTLAQQAGTVLGRELAAMGVTVAYAPACDVNSNSKNPVIGTRSFGETPALVGQLAAAMIAGLQAAGVAATAKHFPGHGDTASDSHHKVPVVEHHETRLRDVEWPPFQAAIAAGVKLMMIGHLALPALHNGVILPATLSPHIVQTRLRQELAFQGVTITDAMDMGAIQQGAGLIIDLIAATAAGEDLLLLKTYQDMPHQIYTGLLQATQRGLLAEAEMIASAERIVALKQWLASQPQPSLEIVGCADHRAVAQKIATTAITLVRDEARRLPLRLAPDQRVAVVTPKPVNFTVADTSDQVTFTLAEAVRRRHPNTTEFVINPRLNETDIAALKQQLSTYDLVIVGTLNAYELTEQATLVKVLQASGIPLIAVAMRMPYDLQAYPTVPTYLCCYSILEPSLEAVAQVLWGEAPAQGQLPVSIPGLYPTGYRAETE